MIQKEIRIYLPELGPTFLVLQLYTKSQIEDYIGQPNKTQDTLKNINTIISKKKVLIENEILDILNLELGKIK